MSDHHDPAVGAEPVEPHEIEPKRKTDDAPEALDAPGVGDPRGGGAASDVPGKASARPRGTRRRGGLPCSRTWSGGRARSSAA